MNVKGNPNLKAGPGRPKGSRNKLSEDFVSALADDFKQFGKEAICLVREEKPDSYLNVIAKLVPKELIVTEKASLEDLTDEQLEAEVRDRLDRVRATLCGERVEDGAEQSNQVH